MRVTMDEAGRIAVPDVLREQLRLAPGSLLEATVEEDRLIATPVNPEVVLVEEDGRLIATTAPVLSAMSQEELLRLIDEDRARPRCP